MEPPDTPSALVNACAGANLACRSPALARRATAGQLGNVLPRWPSDPIDSRHERSDAPEQYRRRLSRRAFPRRLTSATVPYWAGDRGEGRERYACPKTTHRPRPSGATAVRRGPLRCEIQHRKGCMRRDLLWSDGSLQSSAPAQRPQQGRPRSRAISQSPSFAMVRSMTNEHGTTSILVNGVELAVAESGTGEPLVLVHGSWVDRTGWGFVEGELANSYHVVSYDRRGNSTSSPAPGTRRDDEDDLAALIEDLDLAPAHIVANSFGALDHARTGRTPP